MPPDMAANAELIRIEGLAAELERDIDIALACDDPDRNRKAIVAHGKIEEANNALMKLKELMKLKGLEPEATRIEALRKRFIGMARRILMDIFSIDFEEDDLRTVPPYEPRPVADDTTPPQPQPRFGSTADGLFAIADALNNVAHALAHEPLKRRRF